MLLAEKNLAGNKHWFLAHVLTPGLKIKLKLNNFIEFFVRIYLLMLV